MDNEEIRKLLQELKQSSDESSSVRSKIVKIHIDTPEEAQQREKAKRKAREKEERRLAEEAAKAEAEEEARRLAAEKAAQEAVEEAKREARTGFAPDLEEDLLLSAAHADTESSGDEVPDTGLNLNWEYEKPELKSGLVREEDLDLVPAKRSRGTDTLDSPQESVHGTDTGFRPEESGHETDSSLADDASSDDGSSEGRRRRFGLPRFSRNATDNDFESDERDFRSEDEELSPRERESITGLPGRFGELSDRVLSFFGGMRNQVKEDLSKARERKASPEKDGETDNDLPSSSGSDTGADHAAGKKSGSDSGLGYGVTVGTDLMPDTGEDTSWARNASPDPSKEMHELPSYWNGEEGEDGEDPADNTRGIRKPSDGDLAKAGDELLEFPSERTKEEKTRREYGPDEEWKRRMEEPPGKKSFFQKMRLERAALSLSQGGWRKKKGTAEEVPGTEETSGKAEAAQMEPAPGEAEAGQMESASGEAKTGQMESVPGKAEAGHMESAPGEAETAETEETPEKTDASEAEEISGEAAKTEKEEKSRIFSRFRELKKSVKTKKAKKEETSEQTKEPEQTKMSERFEDAEPARESETEIVPDMAEVPEMEKASEPEDAPETVQIPKSIEVINLNENQNNKDAEVIPLTGDTGALPDPAQLRKASKKHRKKKASPGSDPGSAKEPGAPEDAGGRIGSVFQKRRKMILIAVIIIALAVACVCAFIVLSGRMGNQPRETISADEGLTLQVLEQPDSYTRSGDVQIRVKAPETIQSVTVNGESVVIDQGRTVDFTYHASGGTLDIMAVSTDKVRNAKVILAYVDSQAPAVTIREEDGKIALSAEDTESGLEGIYIGTTSGLSDVPQYEKYSTPLNEDPDKEIIYYAKDLAGNTTTPVLVALTPAESIAFSRERYGLFPGSVERVNLVTTPEHAFVNNLKLESENPKVVQVEGDMLIRGIIEGDTKITATADGIAGVMASVSVMGERKVKISAIGDCTLGTDANFSQNTSFAAYEALYGDSYFFEKVKSILRSGDSAFANFEGTLTTSDQREQKTFAFKGDPSYTKILQDAGIDVVNLANNHSRDYGEQSLIDTQRSLEEAGIEWCMGDHIAYRDLNGVLTAYIGIYALENGLDSLPQVKSTIAEAKKKGADLIIIEFHWGAELVREIDDFQKELAHTAVDEGANLVLGSHAHVLQGIEKYKDAYIVYGLSNFCFGGNSDPTSYDTIIWQETFTFTANGLESGDEIAIIPCQVSGDLSSNNYQPVPVSGDAAATIMKTIDDLSAQFGQSYSAYMIDGTLWTESGTQNEN